MGKQSLLAKTRRVSGIKMDRFERWELQLKRDAKEKLWEETMDEMRLDDLEKEGVKCLK